MEAKPPFKVSGSRFFEDTFRPFNLGGNLVTLEQREITDNYKFRGLHIYRVVLILKKYHLKY